MAPRDSAKPKRHKKRKSRTEVSSDSDSESPEISQSSSKPPKPSEKAAKKSKSTPSEPESTTLDGKGTRDVELENAFTKFYMQRLTKEFEDDLDKLRKADDFKDDSLQILIGALQQGTRLFSNEEKRRIVEAGKGKSSEVES